MLHALPQLLDAFLQLDDLLLLPLAGIPDLIEILRRDGVLSACLSSPPHRGVQVFEPGLLLKQFTLGLVEQRQRSFTLVEVKRGLPFQLGHLAVERGLGNAQVIAELGEAVFQFEAFHTDKHLSLANFLTLAHMNGAHDAVPLGRQLEDAARHGPVSLVAEEGIPGLFADGSAEQDQQQADKPAPLGSQGQGRRLAHGTRCRRHVAREPRSRRSRLGQQGGGILRVGAITLRFHCIPCATDEP